MLIEFYGKECPQGLKVAPLVEELRKNIGVTIEQYEVWHNDDNLKKFREYDKGFRGGVPGKSIKYNPGNVPRQRVGGKM